MDIKPNTKIVNIVISTSLEHKIPLERLIMDLPNTEYNPEQFPGLIMKIREPRASFLIFSSGKVVCTDGNDRVLKSQAIPFIMIEADRATVWVEGNVVLLPSEH